MATMELEPRLVLLGRKNGGDWKVIGGDVAVDARDALRERMALRLLVRHEESLIVRANDAAAKFASAHQAAYNVDRVVANGEEYIITTVTRTVDVPDAGSSGS